MTKKAAEKKAPGKETKEVSVEKIERAEKFENVSTTRPLEKSLIDKHLGGEKPLVEDSARPSDGFTSDLRPVDRSNAPRGEYDAKDEIGREERIEILKKFTKQLLEKHGAIIRSVVLFGSTAREEWRGESDIDVFVILDDTRERMSPVRRDNIELDMLDIARSLSNKLSIQQPYLLTEFWAMVREGHPIIFNFIREGIPVYDKDIFLPIKRLLQMGEIRPSKEAVEKYIERAPKRISRVVSEKMYLVVEDLYYAMLESAQAVLMFLGKSPPRPGDAGEELRKSLVSMKLLDNTYAQWMDDIMEVRKGVEHKKINAITGAELDAWIDKADKFVKHMQSLIVKIEVLKRENMVDKSYGIMTETMLTLLKSLNAMPEDKNKFVEAFEAEVIKKGLMDEKYLKLFLDLENMIKKVDEGKVLDVPKKDILVKREHVRKFIREAGLVIREQLKAKN